MRPLVKTLLFIFILVKAHCLETENLFVNRKLTMLRSKIGRDESRLEGLKFLREMAQIEEKLRNDELVKKEKEELLKLINERIWPLTRGNSFMRDLYSGRY